MEQGTETRTLYEDWSARRRELVAEDDVVATYAAPHITVEHVLPQRPKPDSQWQLDFTTGQRAQWTNRLANLVLLARRHRLAARAGDANRGE